MKDSIDYYLMPSTLEKVQVKDITVINYSGSIEKCFLLFSCMTSIAALIDASAVGILPVDE